MELYKLLLLSFFCLFSWDGFTQEYLFDVDIIGVEDGLPEREVYDVITDKQGFLWISTQGAINRYDGKNFKTYHSNELGINEYSSTFLAVDDQNNIWYVEKTILGEANYSGVIDLAADSIYSLEEYTDGLLDSKQMLSLNYPYDTEHDWSITTKQGIVYQYIEGQLQQVYQHPSPPDDYIFHQPLGKDQAWVLCKKKLIKVQNNQAEKTYTANWLYTHLTRIIRHHPTLVIEAFRGLHKNRYYELKEDRLVPYSPSNIPFTDIVPMGNTHLLFFTKDSLHIHDQQGKVVYQTATPAKSYIYSNHFLAQQNILLISTNDGLIKVTRRKNPFKSFSKGYSIRGIHKEKEELLIGENLQTIKYHLPSLTKEVVRSTAEFNSNQTFTSTHKDHQGHLWVGQVDHALLEYIPSKEEPVVYQDPKKRSYIVPFENPITHTLWLGTNKGLAYLDKTTQQIVSYDLPIPGDNLQIRHFHWNKKGMWLITNNGILRFDAEKDTFLKHYTEADGLPHYNFNHLHEDAAGVFWLASKGGGLIRWEVEENKFKQFTQEDGLSNNVLYAVYEDDYNNLWLPSNYGLMQFSKQTTSAKLYLPQNGIPHEEFNTYAHHQTADGTLYFGGLNGVIGFHPKHILENNTQYEQPLQLTEAMVLERKENRFKDITRTYLNNQSIELHPSYQTLNLEFSYLDYESTDNNQYAYRIEGYQDQWIYTMENKISIFKIPYGDYTIKVKARGASGAWTKQELSIPLMVKTSFYRQSWFLFSIISLAIFCIATFIKRREINLKREQKRLEQEIKRRATLIAQAEEIKELDEAKTRFFANITHEFRTPLTLVISPLQQMLKSPTGQIAPNRLKSVLKNAQQLLWLINQLLDISKVESGEAKVVINRGDLVGITQDIIQGFQELAKQKNQDLVLTTWQPEWETYFDKDKWNKIIYNIVFNAIKFTPVNGAIQISLTKQTKQNASWICLKIKDTGIGIAEDQLSKVFNRFYQTDNSSTRSQDGSGIGLALVKELVELQDGEIWVTSKVNQGTTFDIHIPIPSVKGSQAKEVKKTALTPKLPIVHSFEPQEALLDEVVTTNKEALKILIIEDNREMLEYITSCLDHNKYSIYKASNGEEGIKKAQALIPDLIISDIMMPIKDGFEVTTMTRRHIATSHIPIILLTAKATLNSKLKGLERGADAYLVKPFHPEELVLRIQKLIELRQLLQERYQHSDLVKEVVQEKEVISFPEEDKFILNVKQIITDNLENNKLNGETIAQQIGISRMQLHRKLKALTNLTTSKIIQHIRLETAYKLIEEQELNISEISYRTGFSNPNHFSRVFKQKYGTAPSKVIK